MTTVKFRQNEKQWGIQNRVKPTDGKKASTKYVFYLAIDETGTDF